jgi:hypothetical protein
MTEEFKHFFLPSFVSFRTEKLKCLKVLGISLTVTEKLVTFSFITEKFKRFFLRFHHAGRIKTFFPSFPWFLQDGKIKMFESSGYPSGSDGKMSDFFLPLITECSE